MNPQRQEPQAAVVDAAGAPPPPLARALVRSLARGTAIAAGVRFIHVGHERWLAAQTEVLDEVAEDGHSETKFVRGAYGAGKSHFLSVVQDRARNLGWMTSHLECKVDRVQIDRFETLYPQITGKLQAADLQSAGGTDASGIAPDPMWHLLERWARRQLAGAGVREDGINRPFDADNRLYRHLQSALLHSSLPADFTRALTAFSRAHLAGDDVTTAGVCRWLSGAAERAVLPMQYLQKGTLTTAGGAGVSELRPIGKGTAHEIMRGLLWLVRAAGYQGLVLCIDEIEEIAKLGNRRRQDQALQALREFVDHAGGEGSYRHLFMYLAATPEMFEGPDYFPRYDALATRIQPLGREINWRAPVIDLDRTPLDSMQMREMGRRICAVYHAAYADRAGWVPSPEFLQRLVEQVGTAKARIAKPRLLARALINELERARADSAQYRAPTDLAAVVTEAAIQLSRENAR